MSSTMSFLFFLIFIGGFNLAVSELELQVSPDEVYPCRNSKLTVNCTFDTSNITSIDLYRLISISLFKIQKGKIVENVASVDAFSNTIHVATSLATKTTATGDLNTTGSAYLIMDFHDPVEEDSGTYQCEAHGITEFGRLEIVKTELNISDLSPNLHVQPMMPDIGVNVMLKELETIIAKESTFSPGGSYSDFDNFFISQDYGGHHYLVPKVYADFHSRWLLCALKGGYLAEINTIGEYQFLQNWLKTSVHPHTRTTGHSYYTVGLMQNGGPYQVSFLRPHPSQPMFLDWGYTGSYLPTRYACVCIDSRTSFKMLPVKCDERDVTSICEIPKEAMAKTN